MAEKDGITALWGARTPYGCREAAGVSLDWELLAQGAQAVKDPDLLAVAQRFHPRRLRQLTWTNAMLKILSPQILAS
jgi:hypothetical protein